MRGEVIGALRIAIEDLVNVEGKGFLDIETARGKRKAYRSTIMSDMEALLPLCDKNAHFRDAYDIGETFSAMHRINEMMVLLAKEPSS